MPLDLDSHPCFSRECSTVNGRVHLPVAPRCNVQCNFCDRKFDCMNESRPGVTSAVLSPGQAVAYLHEATALRPNLTVVGIAGPGDAFANPDETMETLRRVRAEYPDMLLCVATNGLDVLPYIEEMARLQVTHVTLTVNAVTAETAGSVYAWVRPRTGVERKRVFRGTDAGELMLQRQREAMTAIKAHGIVLKVNTIVIPGVNDHEVPVIARTAREIGADILNCVGMCSVPGTPFEDITPPTAEQVEQLRDEAGALLPQMTHCQRCRADAVGLLGEGIPDVLQDRLCVVSAGPLEPDDDRPCVAAASREGVLVNMHLGEAREMLIYGPRGDGCAFVETRPMPEPGGGDTRWQALAEVLYDCKAVLVTGAGDKPTNTLGENGIQTIVTEGLIEDLVADILAGRPIRQPVRDTGCSSCAGPGTGCG